MEYSSHRVILIHIMEVNTVSPRLYKNYNSMHNVIRHSIPFKSVICQWKQTLRIERYFSLYFTNRTGCTLVWDGLYLALSYLKIVSIAFTHLEIMLFAWGNAQLLLKQYLFTYTHYVNTFRFLLVLDRDSTFPCISRINDRCVFKTHKPWF